MADFDNPTPPNIIPGFGTTTGATAAGGPIPGTTGTTGVGGVGPGSAPSAANLASTATPTPDQMKMAEMYGNLLQRQQYETPKAIGGAGVAAAGVKGLNNAMMFNRLMDMYNKQNLGNMGNAASQMTRPGAVPGAGGLPPTPGGQGVGGIFNAQPGLSVSPGTTPNMVGGGQAGAIPYPGVGY